MPYLVGPRPDSCAAEARAVGPAALEDGKAKVRDLQREAASVPVNRHQNVLRSGAPEPNTCGAGAERVRIARCGASGAEAAGLSLEVPVVHAGGVARGEGAKELPRGVARRRLRKGPAMEHEVEELTRGAQLKLEQEKGP